MTPDSKAGRVPCRAQESLSAFEKQLSEALARLSQLRDGTEKFRNTTRRRVYNVVMTAYKAAKSSGGGASGW